MDTGAEAVEKAIEGHPARQILAFLDDRQAGSRLEARAPARDIFEIEEIE